MPSDPPDWAGAEWQLDAEPDLSTPEPPPLPPPPARVVAPPPAAPRLFPSRLAAPVETPPPERLIEAMLFAGGPPLKPEAVAAVLRGFTAENLRAAVDLLNRRYRDQQRPYAVHDSAGGYTLVVAPAFRPLKAKLSRSPREVRLTQPALDTLSAIAYRQPTGKADIDTLRGADSSAQLRQLVRLGLVTMTRGGKAPAEGGDAPGPSYRTTARFLELLNLSSLEDLPRLGETAALH